MIPGLFPGGFQCPCQLVGAGGSLSAAVDAVETGDGLVDAHAAHEGGYALRVSVAASGKLYVEDLFAVDVDVDLPGAGPLADMGQMSGHVLRACRFAAAKIARTGRSSKSSGGIFGTVPSNFLILCTISGSLVKC